MTTESNDNEQKYAQLVKAINIALTVWVNQGKRRPDDRVEFFIADWLIENRVVVPPDVLH